jgi:hypothetical protein
MTDNQSSAPATSCELSRVPPADLSKEFLGISQAALSKQGGDNLTESYLYGFLGPVAKSLARLANCIADPKQSKPTEADFQNELFEARTVLSQFDADTMAPAMKDEIRPFRNLMGGTETAMFQSLVDDSLAGQDTEGKKACPRKAGAFWKLGEEGEPMYITSMRVYADGLQPLNFTAFQVGHPVVNW